MGDAHGETGIFPHPNPGGRPIGARNKATVAHEKFCRAILESQEYRASLRRRILADTLSPVIEALLHHYAYGKPKLQVHLTVEEASEKHLSELPAPQLALEAQNLAREILQLQEQRFIDAKVVYDTRGEVPVQSEGDVK
jgi:hypothetical protein